MKNPCDNCIVNTMCQNKCCVELEEYIKTLGNSESAIAWNWSAVGQWFREGQIVLYADGRKNWWRMRSDEESMHSVYCQSDM